MPLVVLAVILLVLVLALVALMPLSIVLRYRAGKARRPARAWLAAINLLGFAISAALLLAVAALTTLWVPDAFPYTLLGLAGGCLLGLLGVVLARWEDTPRSLHYTPSRWLVLAITLVVASRMLYGFFRAWHAWRATPDDTSWLAAAGAAGSLAAAAVVLGYYLVFWAGVWRRARRQSPTVTSGGVVSPAKSNRRPKTP